MLYYGCCDLEVYLMSGVRSLNADYITDEHGKKKAVVLSFEDYEELLAGSERFRGLARARTS